MKTKEKQVHSRNSQCQICHKVIVGSSYKFRSHLYRHNEVNSRFKCSYCSKEYFRRDAFDKHVTTHTGMKKYYICDYCERGFVDKRNLINHLRIHDEYFKNSKKEYKCMACGINYCEERLLKYHIRKQHFNLHGNETTHGEKKPNETWVERVMHSDVYVEMTKVDQNAIIIKKTPTTNKLPPVKRTTEKSAFQDYMTSVFATNDMSHYSKAICDYCNKEMLKKSLQSHIRERHLKLKRFNCEVCKASFSRHYQMVNHICGKVRTRKRN